MTDKRILLINPDGTAEVNGVKVRVVPDEPVAWIQRHAGYADRLFFASQIDDPRMYKRAPEVTWEPLLSAAAIDLSGLPRVPERDRRVLGDNEREEGHTDGWNAALDAIGITK